MMRAIRAVSIERGHDPRPFTLMPFGGAGALHASRARREESAVREILVPPSPGILCAEGLVASDLKESFVATCRTPLGGDLARVHAELRRLDGLAREWWHAEQVDYADRLCQIVVDMRYVGQNYELGVLVPEANGASLPPPDVLARLFHAEHERSYGHHDDGAAIEVVNLRVTAIGRLPDVGVPRFTGAGKVKPQASHPGLAHGQGSGGDGHLVAARAGPGTRIEGPAVIEQLDATTPIPPGYRATVDDGLNLVIGVRS